MQKNVLTFSVFGDIFWVGIFFVCINRDIFFVNKTDWAPDYPGVDTDHPDRYSCWIFCVWKSKSSSQFSISTSASTSLLILHKLPREQNKPSTTYIVQACALPQAVTRYYECYKHYKYCVAIIMKIIPSACEANSIVCGNLQF